MNYYIKKTGGAIIRWFNMGRSVFRSNKKSNSNAENALSAQIIKDFNKVRPLGPQPILCYAPYKMMYFAFGGEVIACCHNRKHVLGRYPEQNLKDIWEGRELAVLRDHIVRDDLSYGCEVCKTLLLGRNFDGAKNALYDRYRAKPWPIIMEFELDNTCNLACIICNDLFSSKFSGETRTKSVYDENFVTQLETFIPHLKEAKFYGGEPFLIPIYYKIWESMLRINPGVQIMIQTNGTILNNKVKKLLEQGRFSINVSIDSLDKELFEKIRKNANFEQVKENTLWFAEYCLQKGTHFGIIPTPTRLNWMELQKITSWAGELNARVYFNTLITPVDLALWNLPAKELHWMNGLLSDVFLPGLTAIEKANQIHFRDFVNQMKAWEETNQHSKNHSEKIAVSVEKLQQIKQDFLKHLQISLQGKNNGDKLMQLFHEAIESLRENQETDLIFVVIEKIPLNEIITELETLQVEHIRKTAAKKLFEACGQYIIMED